MTQLIREDGCKWSKEKEKDKKSLWKMDGMNTPLGVMRSSKMSDKESPLGVCSHKIRPTI